MSGGYAAPPPGNIGELTEAVKQLRKRVGELERPTGTQTAQLLARLAALQTHVVTSGSVSHSGPGNTDFTDPPSLIFALPFDSIVTVEIDIPYNGQTEVNSVAQLNAEYSMGHAGNQLNLFEQIGGQSNVSFSFNGSRTRTMLYPAGEYTISPVIARVGLSAGSPSLHFINAGPIRLTASVISTP